MCFVLTMDPCPVDRVLFRCALRKSLLAEEPCGDIAHVRLLQFIVLSIVAVDTHKKEGIYNSIDIEAHVYEAIN